MSILLPGEQVPLGQFESDVAMSRLPPLDPTSALVTGYNDCGEEAIRYLMEVEHLPADHPLVVGLRTHLMEQKKALDLAYLLTGPPIFGSGPSYSSPSLGQTESSHEQLPLSGQTDSHYIQTHEQLPLSGQTDAHYIHLTELHNPGLQSVGTVPDSTVHPDFLHPHHMLPTMSDTDLLIRSLAEEIFSLLEEDDGFYDEEDEEEDMLSYSQVEHGLQATEQ